MRHLAFGELDTPMGRLLLVATDLGLVRLGLPVEPRDDLLARLERRTGAHARRQPRTVDGARRELDEYFAGRRRAFTMPLDLSAASGFRLRSLEAMRAIPYGETVSYGVLAARAGNPRAFRAAGHACATNPIPIVLPCHRVVRRDGDLNWYTGGLRYKELLLRLEGTSVARHGARLRVAAA